MNLIIILTCTIYFAMGIINCTQNTLEYLSIFALAKQNDLNSTFSQIQPILQIPQIVYNPRIGKVYTISNFTSQFYFLDSKQISRFSKKNQLQISGGSVRVKYRFDWQKKQLGSSIHGTAEGIAISDPIAFFKEIYINEDSQPDWKLLNYFNITFSGNFPVSQVYPFTQNDSDTLYIMMNKALDHPAGKKIFMNALNDIYPQYLIAAIKNNSDKIYVNRTINYSYFDYRGEFKVSYDNSIHNLSLENTGLTIAFSQTIKDYDDFQCGQSVPLDPQDPTIYGGHQSYLSNSLLKSTVHYALKNNFFNILLKQQNWQSRAFQFFVGDIYPAIPSLKSLNAMTPLSGRCNANDDENFNFSRNSYNQYKVNINFSCILEGDFGKVADFSILTNNYIQVELLQKSLSFTLVKLTGSTKFNQIPSYKIQNLSFAQFLVDQTLKVAVGSQIFGTGYPTSVRLYPNLQITPNYLYLYDSSVKPHYQTQQSKLTIDII